MTPCPRATLGIAAALFAAGIAGAAAETRTVPAILVAAAIGVNFEGLQVHLNNFGRRHGDSWHVAASSFVRLPAGLGGRTITFTIPELVIRARVHLPLVPDPRFTARYYVSDFNTNLVRTEPFSGAIKITVRFESRGVELKGRCSAGCIAGSDSTAPDFQINNARVDVIFALAALDGCISYASPRGEFHANVDASGIGEFFDGQVKSTIKRMLEPAIASALNDLTIRRRVAAAVRPQLDRMGIGRVTAVRMVGERDVVIDHVPR
jgi:hypothetical protein